MTYLPLGSLIQLGKLNPMLNSLSSESRYPYPLTITGDCIKDFPIRRHWDNYKKLGETTYNLIISNVADIQDVELLLFHFSILNILQLHKLNLDSKLVNRYPGDIRKLKISQCTINGSLLKGWLRKCPNTLTLHLDRTDIIENQSIVRCLELVLDHDMSHLILEGMSTTSIIKREVPLRAMKLSLINCSDFMAKLIKSPRSLLSELRIVAATVYLSYEWLLHKFNTLSLELWGIGEDISTLVDEVTRYTSSQCKHLTLPHLPQNLDWLEKCVNLQSLRILHPLPNCVESKLKDKLASLDKKISVKYTVVPEAKANQIFTLNEDCIQMVLSSLTDTNATIAFGLTAPRFKEIISRTSLPLITIGKETLEKYPLDKDLSAYEMIGRCSTKLKVANINSGHLKEILPLFPCLRELGSTKANHACLVP